MTETVTIPERVDRYVRGELDDAGTLAFEAELLSSPRLQEALEVALGLQRMVEFESRQPAANVVPLHAPAGRVGAPSPRWQAFALAASVAVAAVTVTLLWRSETETARLQSRLAELNRPVGTVLTVPLDVMRSAGSRTPDVRIRKPAGPALLILDVEVAEQLLNAASLNLELNAEQGDALQRWSTTSANDGRIKLALRTDQLPDGILELRMSDSGSGLTDLRLLELLPARKPD